MTFYPHLFWKLDENDYNCSGRTVEEWYLTGTRRSLVGIYYVIYGSVICSLYIVIILAMSNSSILSKCCYKLMYYNCFYDLVNVFLNSIISGYLVIDGAVFCTHPLIILLSGGFGLAFWCGTCVNCIIIGINRFCTIFNTGEQLFNGNNAYYWMSLPILYTVGVLFFTRPVIFHSFYGAWLLTPLINDFSKEVLYYKNYVMLVTNLVTPMSLTCIYIAITSKLFCHKNITIYRQQLSRAQHKICLQSAIICGSTSICCFFYSYMQIFPVPEIMVLLTQVLYQYCTGFQCFVYLFMNQAIHRRMAKLVFQMKVPSVNLMGPSSREPQLVEPLNRSNLYTKSNN